RRPLQGSVAFPVVRGHVERDALHRRPGVVGRAARGVATVRPWDHDPSAVGVEENFSGIEAHPARGIEGTFDAIAVQLTGSYVRNERMPVVIGAVGRWIEAHDARSPRVVDTIEQQ